MPEETVKISGSVESITYMREDTGFTVLEIISDDENEAEAVTVVGVLPHLAVGESVKFSGHWDYHASFGKQFRAELCERHLPSTSADLLKYLSSGIIYGVGPATALKIIEEFGDDAFDVLENSPERLAKIKGISISKAQDICKRFNEQFAIREIMIQLERFGMTSNECLKVYRLYGSRAVDIISENPYILCDEGIGVGFERADVIAQAMHQRPNSLYRTKAGIVFVLKHNLHNGHTCIPLEKLFTPCAELLGTNRTDIEDAIDDCIANKELISEEIDGKSFLFLPGIYLAEKSAAARIQLMMQFPPAKTNALEKEIESIEKKEKINYGDRQKQAIVTAMDRGLLILTGGPGTGKTTTLNAILKLFEAHGLDVALAAPTGRAAKRMSELTGREAKTIHRLLEVEFDGHDRPIFARNARNPIPATAVIVDELSMVDVSLFWSLVDALPLGCRFVMVGDTQQLPPVGAGCVLNDLIRWGKLPIVELKEIFRQAMESAIVTNAHRIVNGQAPDLTLKDKDFFFMERKNTSNAANTIIQLLQKRLPQAYGYSVFNNIQVLCPSRKGETGTVNLNRLIQQAVNGADKSKHEAQFGAKILREGDKVMQIKNNYNLSWSSPKEEGLGVFNGDIGIIKNIDNRGLAIDVLFDDREVTYSFEMANELELAYAATVHKSQGNEFEAVIMPVVNVIPQLCYRNLLYTAVTRAKKMMIIVGEEESVYQMTMNNRKTRRYSALWHFLEMNDE